MNMQRMGEKKAGVNAGSVEIKGSGSIKNTVFN
jgi:hypothetical protein